MSMVVKNGQQLTGAQALDIILAKLEALTSANPSGFGFTAGQYAGFQYVKVFVTVLRAEKFDDPKTEEPWKVLCESKTYKL